MEDFAFTRRSLVDSCRIRCGSLVSNRLSSNVDWFPTFSWLADSTHTTILAKTMQNMEGEASIRNRSTVST